MNQLTPREQQALSLLAEGMTNREIAKAMGISEFVVKNKFRSIFDKIGVFNRLEASLWYVAHAS